jgi:hypothetical protein
LKPTVAQKFSATTKVRGTQRPRKARCGSKL